jgi:hypothetical protein
VTDSRGNRRLLQALLLSSRLVRNADAEEAEGVKSAFSYNATIEMIGRRSDFALAFAALKIEERIAEKSAVEISATYMFGYQGEPFASEEAEFAFLKNLIEVLVWPRFRDLCEITVSQAELDFPRLPAKPDSVSIKAKTDQK